MKDVHGMNTMPGGAMDLISDVPPANRDGGLHLELEHYPVSWNHLTGMILRRG